MSLTERVTVREYDSTEEAQAALDLLLESGLTSDIVTRRGKAIRVVGQWESEARAILEGTAPSATAAAMMSASDPLIPSDAATLGSTVTREDEVLPPTDYYVEEASSGGLSGAASSATGTIGSAASSAADTASSAASTVAGTASSAASTVADTATSEASTVADTTASVASTAANTVQDAASSVADTAGSVASSAASTAAGAASTVADSVSGVASTVADSVSSAATTASDAVTQAATAVAQTPAVAPVVTQLDKATNAAAVQVQDLATTLRERGANPQAPAVQQQVVSTTASVLDKTAQYLEHPNLTVIVEDIRGAVRRNPGRALLLGLGLGFLARATIFSGGGAQAASQTSETPDTSDTSATATMSTDTAAEYAVPSDTAMDVPAYAGTGYAADELTLADDMATGTSTVPTTYTDAVGEIAVEESIVTGTDELPLGDVLVVDVDPVTGETVEVASAPMDTYDLTDTPDSSLGTSDDPLTPRAGV